MSQKKPMNMTIDDELRQKLQELAQANQMTISGLLRWLGARAVGDPQWAGLLTPSPTAPTGKRKARKGEVAE